MVAVLVVAASACSAPLEPSEPATFSKPACEEFRSAARDYVDGVLTEVEMRERLRQVDADGATAAPAVADAARALLRDATQSGIRSREFDGSVKAMGDACRAEGL